MKTTKPGHITKGNIFEDIGFSKSEAAALKIKASIVEALLAEVERRGFTQKDLVNILDEYQPNVSNLLHGRISKVSIEKLLIYADRLRMKSRVELKPTRSATRANVNKVAACA